MGTMEEDDSNSNVKTEVSTVFSEMTKANVYNFSTLFFW